MALSQLTKRGTKKSIIGGKTKDVVIMIMVILMMLEMVTLLKMIKMVTLLKMLIMM